MFTVFWGGREGYHTILNTNVLTELNNLASFFRMAAGVEKLQRRLNKSDNNHNIHVDKCHSIWKFYLNSLILLHTSVNIFRFIFIYSSLKCFAWFSEYKKKIGFTGTLLIEPKPKEPSKHQYDYGILINLINCWSFVESIFNSDII